MKIVILDTYSLNPGDLSWAGIERIGEVTMYDRSQIESTEEILNRIGDAEIVLTNKTPINREILEKSPNIRYIGVLATGFNVVDTEAAKEHNIPVTNIPIYGTRSVAQFAMAQLLEICNRIGHHAQTVQEGKWTNSTDWTYWDYPLIELDQKTIGIIGYGRIGQTTGKLAEAFGMRVLAYKPNGESLGAPYVPLDTLYAESDVITLHTRLMPENEGMINREAIEKMKDGVIILNTARGQLINEQDLADALNCGKVAAAAVDVVSKEPIEASNPLLSAKNCLITPHIAWAPYEARDRIMKAAEENILAFLNGSPIHVVNP